MKTILSILAAAAVYAALPASAKASDDFATRFFEEQRRYGNNLQEELAREGHILHPQGIFGADGKA